MNARCRATLFRRLLKPDSELVHLPRGVEACRVYRNVISFKEQERIHEEWSQVLEKEGEQQVLGSSVENKVVKNTFLEIYGEKDFTEVKSNQRKEIRRLPGLAWSPTMMKVLDEILPALWSTARPDMGRVVEHSLPGYEMHVEHPTVGPAFLYMNLLADTVLNFDDEATGRHGQVYLPAGGVMHVSGETRWGFRFGELSEDVHLFTTPSGTKRRIETDLRLSVQLWNLHPGLLDCRILQDRLEGTLEIVDKKLQAKAENGVLDAEAEKLRDTKEAIQALGNLKETSFSDAFAKPTKGGPTSSFVTSSLTTGTEGSPGSGLLGGEWKDTRDSSQSLSAENLMSNVKGDFSVHKTQFSKIQGVLEEMKALQSKGQPVNDLWMAQKIKDNSVEDAERDAREGYDPEDVEGSWDKVDAKAKFYKSKLKSMDYDGTSFLNSSMPDVSQDAPLDMKATIAKIAPHVRDGENILKNLPQSS